MGRRQGAGMSMSTGDINALYEAQQQTQQAQQLRSNSLAAGLRGIASTGSMWGGAPVCVSSTALPLHPLVVWSACDLAASGHLHWQSC